MNYFIRFENHTLGPFSSKQIEAFFIQERFDDSVRLSTDLAHWHSADETLELTQVLQEHPLRQAPRPVTMPTDGMPPANATHQSHALLRFLLACLFLILGFGTIIFYIVQKPNSPVNVGILHKGNDFSATYQKYQKAIAMVVVTITDNSGNTLSLPIGTAFAISPTTFVSNAHVAYAVKNQREELVQYFVRRNIEEKAQKEGMSLVDFLRRRGSEARRIEENTRRKLQQNGLKVREVELRINHSEGKGYDVKQVQVHRKYDGENNKGEFDLALFTIEGKSESHFPLAQEKELEKLHAGLEVASAGFPTEGLSDYNIDAPEATFGKGIIKKVTDFNHRDAGPKHNRSITHDIPATGGASGSPVFLANGKVIGVLWGVSFAIRTGGISAPSGALQNAAVRIDQLNDMTTSVSWKEWVNQK